jgi:hypothetical protein
VIRQRNNPMTGFQNEDRFPRKAYILYKALSVDAGINILIVERYHDFISILDQDLIKVARGNTLGRQGQVNSRLTSQPSVPRQPAGGGIVLVQIFGKPARWRL